MATYYKFIGYTPCNTVNTILDDSCPFGPVEYDEYSRVLHKMSTPGVLAGVPPRDSDYTAKDYVLGAIDIPPTRRVQLIDESRKIKRTAEEFRALQSSGKVVISPRYVCDIAATLLPSPPESTVFKPDTNIYHFGDPRLKSPFAVDSYTAERMTYCGRQLPFAASATEVLGVPLGVTATVPSGNVHVYPGRRLYEQGQVFHLTLPPESAAATAAALVRYALDHQAWDRGLITRAIAEMNEGAWDLLTEIGELRETIGWIFGLLQSGVKLVVDTKRQLKQARNKPGQSAAAIADEVASIWMQFRYAFSPIGYSVNDALDYLLSSFKPYETSRSGTNTTLDVDFPSGWSIEDIKFRDRVFVKYRFSADYHLHNLGFNPAATAWELTPLSFVVDWILNIGDLLSALHVPANVLEQGCSYSRQLKEDLIITTPEGRFILHVGYYNLIPFNPLDRVGLTVDFTMTWKRWLDAIALTWGGLRKSLIINK